MSVLLDEVGGLIIILKRITTDSVLAKALICKSERNILVFRVGVGMVWRVWRCECGYHNDLPHIRPHPSTSTHTIILKALFYISYFEIYCFDIFFSGLFLSRFGQLFCKRTWSNHMCNINRYFAGFMVIIIFDFLFLLIKKFYTSHICSVVKCKEQKEKEKRKCKEYTFM